MEQSPLTMWRGAALFVINAVPDDEFPESPWIVWRITGFSDGAPEMVECECYATVHDAFCAINSGELDD